MGAVSEQVESILSFDDNTLLAQLYGEQDAHLLKLEELLNVRTASRGNQVSVSGSEKEVGLASSVLQHVYARLQKARGKAVSEAELLGIINTLSGDSVSKNSKEKVSKSAKTLDSVVINTPKLKVKPFSKTQASYMHDLMHRDVTFAAGPAGTGKTYIAVAAAVAKFAAGEVDRIILSRPAVEAGENLGFLPGDMKEKVDPYLRPLYDALYDMMPGEKVVKCIENGQIEIAPLAFMRGRTLRNSYVILDEAQNTTPVQMKMFLTRLGEGSHMAITGDLSQTDLPKGQRSGFRDALEKLEGIDEIGNVAFTGKEVVRHALTTKIVEAYAAKERFDKYERND